MKNFATKLIGASIVTAAAVAASAGGAAALTSGAVACADGTVTGTIECEGVFTGNNSNQDLNGLFDLDWGTEILKVDGSSGTAGALKITDSSEKTGTWQLEQSFVDMYDEIMFVVKGGPSFSAYLWDGLATSGTWDTFGIQKGNGKAAPGLSHFSVYGVKTTDEPTPASVPEPAAMLGLVAVGAGIVVKRRKDLEQA